MVGFDETLNWFPSWGAVPDDAKVVHFYGARKPWREPEMYGAPLWRAYETTWQEIACGLWNSQPEIVERTLAVDAGIGTALRATRQGRTAMRVLEIGCWDFPRMARTAREWLRMTDDRWHVLFRPHVDGSALEEAVVRFGVGLGGLAALTSLMAALTDRRHNGGNEDAMVRSGGPVALCKLPAAGSGQLGLVALDSLAGIAE